MLRLFQRNTVFQAMLILLALVLLWLRPLMAGTPLAAGDHPAVLYGLVCRWLEQLPRLAIALAMLLVLAEGLALNILLSTVGLVSQNSLLPTLLYVLAMGAGATTLTPLILVNAAIIACLSQLLLLRGTLLTIPIGQACGATALIGLASLFYQPAALFILSYLLIAANYRLYGWKDWLVMLLGFAMPYLPLLGALYLADGVGGWWDDTVASFAELGFTTGGASATHMVGAALLAVALVWSVLHTASRLTERPVVWQKNASTVMLLAVGGAALLFIQPLLPFQPALFAIPFAFCTNRILFSRIESHSSFGHKKNRPWLNDMMLVLIIVAAFLC